MKKIGEAKKKEVIGNLSAAGSHRTQTVHLHKINLCPADSFYVVPLVYIILFAQVDLTSINVL